MTEGHDRVKSRRPLAKLQQRNVGSVQFGLEGQRFLSMSAVLTEPTKNFAEYFVVFFVIYHSRLFITLMS